MSYVKGRRAEYRVMRLLEAAGYVCVRTAGSHSPADVVAWRPGQTEMRFIQVKATRDGTGASPAEREALTLWVPQQATCEIWRLADRRPPVIEVL